MSVSLRLFGSIGIRSRIVVCLRTNEVSYTYLYYLAPVSMRDLYVTLSETPEALPLRTCGRHGPTKVLRLVRGFATKIQRFRVISMALPTQN